jgi:succinate dehydrogenase / fumarate reductase cytochrome b subunit
MASIRSTAWSSVGKKLISGITGLVLFSFVVVHLLGNLTIFISADAFNHYAHFLESLFHGWAVIVFEIGLLAVLLFHILSGIWVSLIDKAKARPTGYRKKGNAGGPSRKTLSSRGMIITGSVIAVFIILHVRMFKFGETAMIPLANGEQMRDLYSLVIWSFKNIWVSAAYMVVMVLLGAHLWHGFWSAFQSLGWTNPRFMPVLQGLAVVFALALGAGFFVLPVYAYLFVDPETLHLAQGGVR